jgi:hypothetical protein
MGYDEINIFEGASGGKTIPVRLKNPQNVVGKASDALRNSFSLRAEAYSAVVINTTDVVGVFFTGRFTKRGYK